ncbi:hypothetical protein WJX73_001472 [Symbiochloris irregularis]|uniref:Plant heme peroxidase family profile domain-containing protein n=1 Tax=Symbiochloris irregularis TaxID=706552 RepID=A0AAW1NXL4_9CHLO
MHGQKVEAAYIRALQQFREAVTHSLEAGTINGPALVRLAIHDATTYDCKTNTSGTNGSIRTKKELEQPGNENLSSVVAALAKAKHAFSSLTHADAIQQAAVVAIQAAGGPTISITPGRQDSWTFPPPGLLFAPVPGDDQQSVTAIRAFANRTGLLLRAVVALMGASSYSRWWGQNQHDKLVSKPGAFDNSFFRSLVEGRSPSDGWLLSDEELRHYCEEYAADQTLFFKDYAVAHEEMSRLGTRLHPTTAAALAAAHAADASLWESLTPLQTAAACIIAGGVVAIGVGAWWNRRRRLRRIV